MCSVGLRLADATRNRVSPDSLRKGSGTAEVDRSHVVLIYCMPSYFMKINCAKELFRAVLRGKELVW